VYDPEESKSRLMEKQEGSDYDDSFEKYDDDEFESDDDK